MKRQNLKYYLALAVSLLAFVVYVPSLRNNFVDDWDDIAYIIENPFIRSFDISFFRWSFFDFYAANWHPLTWISHALDYAVWGLNPLGHHLTNNILHAVNTFLVVLLAARLIEAVLGKQPSSSQAVEWPNGRVVEWSSGTTQLLNYSTSSQFTLIAAATTGLLFGLHPLHVESVAWVAERKNLLCALFYLLSIMMYMSYRSHKTYRTYFLTLSFFTLALMSKPMAVSLPVVLLILDWHPFGRIESLKTFRAAFMEKLPFFALGTASSVLTVMAQKAGGAIKSVEIIPLSSRVLVAAKSLVAYLWKMIVPINLSPYYPYPKDVSLSSVGDLSLIMLALAITVFCMVMVKKQKLFLAVWAYYVVTLIPVLGIVQVGGQSMADRYTYLPSVGPFLIIGLMLSRAWAQVSTARWWGLGAKAVCASVAFLVLVTMSYLTFRQIDVWKNNVTLWSYVIDIYPTEVHFAFSNRGIAFARIGQLDRAIEDLDKAVALGPTDHKSYYNRGLVFEQKGQLDKAIADYSKAISLNSSYFDAYYKRGLVFEEEGQLDKAIADFDNMVRLNPSHLETHVRLGVLLGKSGLFNEAIEHFNKAIDINPDYSSAYGNRGFAYSIIGQYDKALRDLYKAIELNKNNATAYFNRGHVYLKTNNRELALSDFRIACDLGNKQGCDASQAVIMKSARGDIRGDEKTKP